MFSSAMSLPALCAVWRCVFNCVCVDLLLTPSCVLFEITCVSCHAARGQHPKRSIYELTEEKPYWAQRKSQVSSMIYCFICIKWMLRLNVLSDLKALWQAEATMLFFFFFCLFLIFPILFSGLRGSTRWSTPRRERSGRSCDRTIVSQSSNKL